jgi:hypothetical protein
MMQFMEFNRRLAKCRLDDDTRMILSHMFEVQIEFSKQLDTASSLIAGLVESVQNFAALHESTQQRVKELLRQGRPDGVEVYSVRNEGEE